MGALSLPLKPPMAITARPLPICSGDALCAPLVAAAHRVVVLASNAVSAVFEGPLDDDPPPLPPIPDDAGPAEGMLPECAWLAVETA